MALLKLPSMEVLYILAPTLLGSGRATLGPMDQLEWFTIMVTSKTGSGMDKERWKIGKVPMSGQDNGSRTSCRRGSSPNQTAINSNRYSIPSKTRKKEYSGVLIRSPYQTSNYDCCEYCICKYHLKSSLTSRGFGVLGFWGDRKSVV